MNKYEITFIFDREVKNENEEISIVSSAGRFRVAEKALDSYIRGMKVDEVCGKVSNICVKKII